MYTRDPNQRLRPPGPGQPINKSDLQKIVALIMQTVRGGDGILVERHGQNVIIRLAAGPRGGGGGGGGGIWYVADTKAELPNTDIASTAMARAQGEIYVRNPANNGWDSITHLE